MDIPNKAEKPVNDLKKLLKLDLWVDGLSDVSMAIRLIVKGIRAFQSLLKKEEREAALARKNLFESTLIPAYSEMAEIHADYMDVCARAIRVIPTKIEDGWWMLRTKRINQDKAQHLLREIRDEVEIQRQELLGKRIALRQDAESVLRGLDDVPLEAAFLYSIINYFLRQEMPEESLSEMARHAGRIGREGADATLNTPSTEWMDFLDDEEDPERIREFFISERTKLSEYWSDVTCRYRDLSRASKSLD